MKIIRKTSRFSLTFRIKQIPWNFNKMIKLKSRKWSRIKFSRTFLSLKKNTGRAMNFRFFTTYKNKTKKLFRRFFAPKLSDRQCKKLFRSNSRYKATFKKVLKSEYRLDTLIFRLFMLPDVTIARELIKKNYFLLNGKILSSPKIILNVGDFVEPTNKIAWHFLYNNMLSVIASLKKYFSRIFFKFSFPFVIKRKRFRVKEFGKYKHKNLNHVTNQISTRITRRVLYSRYRKIKPTTTSKIRPPKRYLFKEPKEETKTRRLKNYILKKVKLKNNYSFFPLFITKKEKQKKKSKKVSYLKTKYFKHVKNKRITSYIFQKFKKTKLLHFKKQRRQLELLFKLRTMNKKAISTKDMNRLRFNISKSKKQTLKLKLPKKFKIRLQLNHKKILNTKPKQKSKKRKTIKNYTFKIMRRAKKIRNFKTKKIVLKLRKRRKLKHRIISKLKNKVLLNKTKTLKKNLNQDKKPILKEKWIKKIQNLTLKKKWVKSLKKLSLEQQKKQIFSKKNQFSKKIKYKLKRAFKFLKYKFKKLSFQKQNFYTNKNFFKKANFRNKTYKQNVIKKENSPIKYYQKAKKKITIDKIYKLAIFNLYLHQKTKHWKLTKKPKHNLKFTIKQQKPRKKPFWRRFIPKTPQNYWQTKRITKKHVLVFHYLKKFNNRYKQYRYYQNLKQIQWNTIPTTTIYKKTTFLFEKKRKQLLSNRIYAPKSTVLSKTKVKTLSFFRQFSLKRKNSLKKTLTKKILRIKRKYLLLKGFYRKYKNLKIKVGLTEKQNIYNPIQIRYKKINLLFKHRPIAYYFAEVNYNSLEFTLINDVDFLFFPYRTFFDFKMLSFIYPK